MLVHRIKTFNFKHVSQIDVQIKNCCYFLQISDGEKKERQSKPACSPQQTEVLWLHVVFELALQDSVPKTTLPTFYTYDQWHFHTTEGLLRFHRTATLKNKKNVLGLGVGGMGGSPSICCMRIYIYI